MCWDETRMNDGLDCTIPPSISMSYQHQHQHQHPAISGQRAVYLGLPSIYQGRLLADCLYSQGHAAQPKSGTAQPSPSQTRQAQWQLPRRWLDFFLLLTRIRTPLSATLHRDPTPFPLDPGRPGCLLYHRTPYEYSMTLACSWLRDDGCVKTRLSPKQARCILSQKR